MTIKECVDRWVTMDDDLKEKLGNTLFDMLTPISRKELEHFQHKWRIVCRQTKWANFEEEYQAFVAAQQEKLRMCVTLETSNVGHMVRQSLGLPDIHWTDHIPEDAEVVHDGGAGERGLEAAAKAEAANSRAG